MKRLLLSLPLCFFAVLVVGQQAEQSAPPASQSAATTITVKIPEAQTVVLSDNTSTVRIAEPNELIGINGHIIKVSDFMASLSSDSALVQHLHILEKQNSSDSPQTPPATKKGSKKSVSGPEAQPVPQGPEAVQKP
jgi:hypothetical protein